MPRGSAVKPRKSPERVMPDRERQELIDQIEQEKAFQSGLGRDLPEGGTLGALGEAGDLSVDKSKLTKRIGNMTRAVEAGEAKDLKGEARNRAIARHKELEAHLPDVLLTMREQDLFPRDGHDYHAAVRKATRYEVGNQKTQKDIAEYRNLGRSLWPDDPDRSSIERLRKIK